MSWAPLLAIGSALGFGVAGVLLRRGLEYTGPVSAAAVAIVAGGVLLARRSHEERPWRRRDMILPLLGALGFAIRDNLSRWGFREYGDALTAAAAATVTSLAMMWLVAGVRRARLDLPGIALVFLICSGLFEGLAYLSMWRSLAIRDV